MAFTSQGVGTLAIWFWSWGVTRGVMRTICSVCAGDWYVSEVRSFRFFFRNFNCFDLV